jgi:hypothetical protein
MIWKTLCMSGLPLAMSILCGCGDNAGKHVGSRECDVIKESTADPATHEACDACQGAVCGGSEACGIFPCVDEKIVIQGCEEDEDCAGFPGMRCGMYSGPDSICSSHPDDQ